ncbi:MAG: type II secretory pathway component PulJ, partial [Burkholderiales bacterium]|nr:type II secretory pathway component PulJ [Burkholderiales bacterium]
IQIAFAQIENDCAHLADNSILPGREVMQAAGSRLLIIRTVFEENQPTRLQVVSYRVVNGVFSRRQSVATRELAVLDEDWQRALNDAEEVPAITLQTGVSNIAMRTWTNGESGWRIAGSEASTGSSAVSAVSALSNKKRTGLEIALQLQGNALPMIKAFLLGAV